MFMLPFAPLVSLLLGILSLALLGFGLYWVFGWFLGAVTVAALFYSGIAMVAFSFLGRYILLFLLGGRGGQDDPEPARSRQIERIQRPDGTELHVEFFGPPGAQPIIFTHGIAADSTNWYYAKRHLSDRFRLVLWDVTGLGRSDRAKNGNYSLERMAADLEAVLQMAGPRPAILASHSMGGMITLTFCRMFPHHLGSRVAGLALVNTTYINPVRTATARGLLTALQKPVLTPILYLIIGLFPLVWLQNWLSYFNGTAYFPTRFGSFCGRQTREQMDYMAYLNVRSHPAVLGKQMLAMFKYDATEVLPRLNLPVLIVAANHDRGCIPEASEYMHSQIPGSELVTLEPSGHVSILEQNEGFTTAMANFAGRLSGEQQTGRAASA